MTKPEFISLISTHLNLSKTDAAKFVDGYTEVVVAALKAEGDLTLPGLVKLTVKTVEAKPAGMAKNPFTGQMVPRAAKPASKTVKAKPVTLLKKAIV